MAQARRTAWLYQAAAAGNIRRIKERLVSCGDGASRTGSESRRELLQGSIQKKLRDFAGRVGKHGVVENAVSLHVLSCVCILFACAFAAFEGQWACALRTLMHHWLSVVFHFLSES